MRQARDDDAELELRLRHLEESNASLRAELAAVKAVNAEAHRSVDRVLDVCRPDAASAVHGSDLRAVHVAAARELAELRDRVTVAAARVESVELFARNEDARRSAMLEQLERVVRQIEHAPAPPSFAPRIQTRLLAGGGGGGGGGGSAAGSRGSGPRAGAAGDSAPDAATDDAGGTFPSVPPRYHGASTLAGTFGAPPRPLSVGGGGGGDDAAVAPESAAVRARAAAQLTRDRQAAAAAAVAPTSSGGPSLASLWASAVNASPNVDDRPGATADVTSGSGVPAQGSVFQVAPGSPHGAVPSFRHRLMAFYSKYNPAKLSEVPTILREFAGAEDELMRSLEAHYDAFGYFDYDLSLPTSDAAVLETV